MGRPTGITKKVKTTTVENTEIKVDSIESQLETANKEKEDMAKIIAQMQEQMKTLSEQVKSAKSEQIIVKQENGFSGKKIKCINLMHNPLNVSTEVNGTGRVYSFDKYGDTRLIKFDDLSDIVASYPNTVENGYLYIANADVVDELGLTEEYQNIYTKEMIDEVIYLRKESDVDLFVGMAKDMQESSVVEMAKLLSQNEFMDRNYLAEIKDKTGYDIEQLAKDIKEENTKANEVD